MVVNVPKPDNELLEMAKEYNGLFIVACGGCPVGCSSGGEARIEELKKLLTANAKTISGSVLIDFLCNKALVGTRLQAYVDLMKKAEALLVVSCGIGVQATQNMVDMPSLPANDTLAAQGMQGLWPSVERCAGCGTCYLALTGGVCPITMCAKHLLNGMCGGQHDGKCEVEKTRDCGWYMIYTKLEELGKLDNLKKIPTLRDFRKIEVSETERNTTRWALEKQIIYEAPKQTTVEAKEAKQ